MKKVVCILICIAMLFASVQAAAMISYGETSQEVNAALPEGLLADGPVDGLYAEQSIGFDAEEYDGTINENTCIVLMDAERGTVLFEQNPDRKAYPASTTKMLSTLIAIESGNLDTLYTVGSEVNLSGNWSTMTPKLVEGETISLRDMIYGAMLPSGCEASAAIGVAMGGSEAAFVAWMNNRASALGMYGSNFVNTNGMSNNNHFSTAMDMTRLARAAMKNDTFRQVASTYVYYTSPTNKQGVRTLTNTNYLINPGSTYFYSGAIGIKTGTTSAALYCLAAEAERDGHSLICVVLRAPTDAARYQYTTDLLNWGFENCSAEDTELFWQTCEKVNRLMNVSEETTYYYAPSSEDACYLGTADEGREFLIKYDAEDSSGNLWYFTSEGYFVPASAFEEADSVPVWGFCEDLCRPLPEGNYALGTETVIGGTVYADHYIDTVTAMLYNEQGECVFSDTVQPYDTYYNLDSFNGSIPFAELPAGEYELVIACASNEWTYNLNSSFAIIEDCTVTFYDNNYNIVMQVTVPYGGSVTPPDAPEVEGLTFYGWHGNYTEVTSDSMVIAVYYVTPCMVTFVGYTGEILKTQVVAYGSAATAPEPPNIEGMSFAGWDKDFSCVTEDITVNTVYVQSSGSLIIGDVNGDGMLSFSDIALIYNYLLGGIEEDPQLAANADVNGDGELSFTDIVMLYESIITD